MELCQYNQQKDVLSDISDDRTFPFEMANSRGSWDLMGRGFDLRLLEIEIGGTLLH